jgi:hypothetical protein
VGCSTLGIVDRPTYTFNLHGFAILDRAREGDIWMPAVVQLFLLRSWNVEGNWADVANLS